MNKVAIVGLIGAALLTLSSSSSADDKVVISITKTENKVVACTTYRGSANLADRVMREAEIRGLKFSHVSCERANNEEDRSIFAACVRYVEDAPNAPAMLRDFAYSVESAKRVKLVCEREKGVFTEWPQHLKSLKEEAREELATALRQRRLSAHGQW